MSRTRHHTVLEVICYASMTRTCVVASSWGEKARWLENIMANPDTELTLGGRTRGKGTADVSGRGGTGITHIGTPASPGDEAIRAAHAWETVRRPR